LLGNGAVFSIYGGAWNLFWILILILIQNPKSKIQNFLSYK
jgi:hypothetical protein